RAARASQLVALRVVAELAEVEEHAGLVAHDLGVVPRRDRDGIAGSTLALGAVVHEHLHAARHAVSEVRDLAGVRPSDRLDVVRPAPAGLEGAAPNGVTAELEH